MKPVFVILASFLFSLAKAQLSFKTNVPQQAIVVGESFQVQYIIEDVEKPGTVIPPEFTNFGFVAGPNIYTGLATETGHNHQTKNQVYTLKAIKTGRFIIQGASTVINGKSVRSNDVVVEVISKEEEAKRFNRELEQSNSTYILHPGEDAYEKIRKNLFLKVMVDKTGCFVGEPIVATYKLYSRLESKSDIIKNPGFYGFTVYDMINLDDQQSVSEVIDGKTFDVHTIRKVQLYPLQPGQFNIDAMEVKNRVEFSRSIVDKKTEQEITEGVLGNNTDKKAMTANTEIFETTISTDPLSIHVKPAPAKSKPALFNGATGQFVISASISKEQLARDEEGRLDIIIGGQGNFTQLSAPVFQWPPGLEGFEPIVKDLLDKTQSPLSGNRVFQYAFVSAKPGTYLIPAITFSFFDPSKNSYQTVSTSTLPVIISSETKKGINGPGIVNKVTKERHYFYWWFAGGILFGLAGTFLFFFFYKKRDAEKEVVESKTTPPTKDVEEIFFPATLLLRAGDKSFYSSLQQATWMFLSHQLNLAGSAVNKENLFRNMRQKNISEELIEQVRDILQQCEAGLFTDADLLIDKGNLLRETKKTLENISKSLL